MTSTKTLSLVERIKSVALRCGIEFSTVKSKPFGRGVVIDDVVVLNRFTIGRGRSKTERWTISVNGTILYDRSCGLRLVDALSRITRDSLLEGQC